MKPTDLRKMMRLMTTYRIERLHVSPDGSVDIVKKIHLADLPERPEAPADAETQTDVDDEILFYSSGAPKRTLEEMDRMAVIPPKEPDAH